MCTWKSIERTPGECECVNVQFDCFHHQKRFHSEANVTQCLTFHSLRFQCCCFFSGSFSLSELHDFIENERKKAKIDDFNNYLDCIGWEATASHYSYFIKSTALPYYSPQKTISIRFWRINIYIHIVNRHTETITHQAATCQRVYSPEPNNSFINLVMFLFK